MLQVFYHVNLCTGYPYKKNTMLVFRMIEKFSGGSSDVENMIDIQFQQTAAQDKNSKFDYDFHSYGHVVIW